MCVEEEDTDINNVAATVCKLHPLLVISVLMSSIKRGKQTVKKTQKNMQKLRIV